MPKQPKSLYIREYGKIQKGEKNQGKGIDEIVLNTKAWEFLANSHANSRLKDDRFIEVDNLQTLKIKNFVGVITTPDGTQIEILPKTENDESAQYSRNTLAKMLKTANSLPFIQTTEADLQVKNQPLPEILIHWFLECVAKIVKKGIRRDYIRIANQEKFLKGQLQLQKQVNEPPHRQHLFHIEYDILSLDRAENRLIHSALMRVAKWSQDNHNQSLAKHLIMLFDEVPLSINYKNDFQEWATSRDMNYYQTALPWLKLILNQQSPFTLQGIDAGISFLIPMEKLFEKYVAIKLKQQLQKSQPQYYLKEQVSSKYLSDTPKAFLLKPDMAIYKKGNGNPVYILDTKWKLIDENAIYNNGNDNKKKNISQSDMYQLFAYGKKYDNVERLVLIYPQWAKFKNDFNFILEDSLTLNVVPYSLDKDIKISDLKLDFQ